MVIVVFCLLISFGVMYIYNCIEKKPYAKISKNDISEVSILFGTYEPYQLTENATDEFINMLKDVVIYKKDNTYVEYNGVQTSMFCIEKTNGKKIYISAANPFFIINGTGYRTEYLPCDRLSRFYVEIVQKNIIAK